MTRILFVDDEPNVLAGLERQLRRRYAVTTAVGGEAGLAVVAGAAEPFAVVVSDMRMPGMSGAQFLAEVRRRWPETTRLLLTGQTDLQSAIEAMNRGGLFRFLTKPCDTDDLTAALDAAVEQHRLVTSERELLDRTLRGCVQVLGEVLALANPAAFGRALRVQGLIREISTAVPAEMGWEVEVAAILSHLGSVAIPEWLATAADRGQTLSPDDQAQLDRAARVASELIAHIPRMERVVDMIVRAGRPFDPTRAETAAVGLFRLATEFDGLLARGIPRQQALALLMPHTSRHNPSAVAALERLVQRGYQPVSRELPVSALTPAMTLEIDLYSAAGVFLLRHGNAITTPMRLRLESLAASGQIPPTLRVLITPPAGS